MKIAIFTDTYFPQLSGVATSVKVLKDTFEAHGHEVYIFTTTDPQASKDEDHIFRYESIPFLFFKERRVAVTFFGPVVKKVKDLEIDIIHTQTEFSMGMLGITASRILGLPLVHTYHTWYEKYLHYIMKGKLISKETVRKLSRLYCQQADEVITPSQTIKEVLESYGVTREIAIVPTGVPIPDCCSQAELMDLRQKLTLSADDFVMLSVNRLAYEKNLIAIIDRLPSLLKHLPQAHLVLVGDGPERKNLENAVASHGLGDHVHFTGAINHEKLSSYYQMADLYVNLSTSETQGLTFLEAITNHLPIVAYASDYLMNLAKIQPFGVLLDDPDKFEAAVLEVKANSEAYSSHLDQLIHHVSAEHFYEQLYAIYSQVQPRKSLVTDLSQLTEKLFYVPKTDQRMGYNDKRNKHKKD